MLAGKRHVLANISGDKDLPKSMEICEILPKTGNVCGGDGITANYVAAVQERRETLHHFIRDMAMNGGNIDLYNINHYQERVNKGRDELSSVPWSRLPSIA